MRLLSRRCWECTTSLCTSECPADHLPPERAERCRYSSILSAYGMALADVAVDLSEPFVQEYSPEATSSLESRFSGLQARAQQQLQDQGEASDSVTYDRFLSLQYQGSDTTLMVAQPADGDFAKAFVAEHKREFAFVLDAPIMIAGVRVRATAKSNNDDSEGSTSPYMDELRQQEAQTDSSPKPQPFARNSVYFEEVGSFEDVPLYRLEELAWGTKISGPAVILDNTQTIVLHPQNTAKILRSHVL